MIASDSRRKQLNVRIPSDLHDKIESSGKGKQDIVIAALELYFDSINDSKDDSKQLTNDSRMLAALESEVTHLNAQNGLKDEIIKSKDQTIRTLENQAGFLISEFQRMSGINERLLMPAPGHAPEVKKWWQVWK